MGCPKKKTNGRVASRAPVPGGGLPWHSELEKADPSGETVLHQGAGLGNQDGASTVL